MIGIAIGVDRLESIEFEGTIFVNTKSDNDWNTVLWKSMTTRMSHFKSIRESTFDGMGGVFPGNNKLKGAQKPSIGKLPPPPV